MPKKGLFNNKSSHEVRARVDNLIWEKLLSSGLPIATVVNYALALFLMPEIFEKWRKHAKKPRYKLTNNNYENTRKPSSDAEDTPPSGSGVSASDETLPFVN